MGRPITVRHTGSEGDLCDSLTRKRKQEQGRALSANARQRLTFVYTADFGMAGIAIPRLEVAVGDVPVRRSQRTPVPAPKAVGNAHRTTVPRRGRDQPSRRRRGLRPSVLRVLGSVRVGVSPRLGPDLAELPQSEAGFDHDVVDVVHEAGRGP
jgi:hypothetical protein